MIKFNKEPKLNAAEKEYVLKYIKPLLLQNKIAEVREQPLTYTDDDIITYEERMNITGFLLSHLQDNYFRGSNKIIYGEFEELDILYIDIPSWVTGIDEFAFEGCRNLRGVSIPDGITRIEEGTFLECENLENIVIPQTVTQIGVQAFYGCSSLTDVYIPDKVKWIDSGAFEDCSNLKRISVPRSCGSAYDAFDKDVEIKKR